MACKTSLFMPKKNITLLFTTPKRGSVLVIACFPIHIHMNKDGAKNFFSIFLYLSQFFKICDLPPKYNRTEKFEFEKLISKTPINIDLRLSKLTALINAA